ncbi:hypothetical protein Bca4012_027258 [Brassica carinata]|uniref:Uncharacterized protein n=1 Tax=Brassica carinata TaxID=52824 RepID=A0A8X8AVJ7_BRACI|nr:hypothetical protein Bca52824_024255 [Brassica carinata]
MDPDYIPTSAAKTGQKSGLRMHPPGWTITLLTCTRKEEVTLPTRTRDHRLYWDILLPKKRATNEQFGAVNHLDPPTTLAFCCYREPKNEDLETV